MILPLHVIIISFININIIIIINFITPAIVAHVSYATLLLISHYYTSIAATIAID